MCQLIINRLLKSWNEIIVLKMRIIYMLKDFAKIFDFLSVSGQWSEIYLYSSRYISCSTELMKFKNRGLYELHSDNNRNLTTPRVVFKCNQSGNFLNAPCMSECTTVLKKHWIDRQLSSETRHKLLWSKFSLLTSKFDHFIEKNQKYTQMTCFQIKNQFLLSVYLEIVEDIWSLHTSSSLWEKFSLSDCASY